MSSSRKKIETPFLFKQTSATLCPNCKVNSKFNITVTYLWPFIQLSFSESQYGSNCAMP